MNHNKRLHSIAIVGSGAIGLYYGGRLAAQGHDVRFLLRSDYAHIQQHGIQATSIDGDFHLPQVNAHTAPSDIGPVDLVIIAWKATSNHLLEKILPPLMHAHTQVLTLQNGLGNCEALEKFIPADRILGALCFVCINRLSPGVVDHSAGGKVMIAEYAPGLPDRAQEIATLLESAHVPAGVERSVEEGIWKKLIWNIPFNGLSIATGGQTTDLLLADPATLTEIRALMEEVVAAAAARGFHLDKKLIDWNIERTYPMAAYRPSSLIDWQAGREVEIQALWAEPLKRATQAGLTLPHLTSLLARIKEKCTPA